MNICVGECCMHVGRGREGGRGEEGREDEKLNTVSSLVMESYIFTEDFPEILCAKLEPLLFTFDHRQYCPPRM